MWSLLSIVFIYFLFTPSEAQASHIFCYSNSQSLQFAGHNVHYVSECEYFEAGIFRSSESYAKDYCLTHFRVYQFGSSTNISTVSSSSRGTCEQRRNDYLNSISPRGNYIMDFAIRSPLFINNGGVENPGPLLIKRGNEISELAQWVLYPDGEFYCGFTNQQVTFKRGENNQILIRLFGENGLSTYTFTPDSNGLERGFYIVDTPFRLSFLEGDLGHRKVHSLRMPAGYQYSPDEYQLLDERGQIIQRFWFYFYGGDSPLNGGVCISRY